MSQDSDESDDEFCCKLTVKFFFGFDVFMFLIAWLTNFFTVLTPSIHQYSITEKIKEANSILFSNTETQPRQSQPKVKFRDHKLVDYECESHVVDEMSDDGYSEEIVDATEKAEESIEIEEVCEQIQQLEADNSENDEKELIDEENYDKESFHEEVQVTSTENLEEPSSKKSTSLRSKASNKVNPADVGSRKDRRKDCCQFKETDEYKKSLPVYCNGGKSTYGLSKEEKQRREFIRYQREFKKQQKLDKQLEERAEKIEKTEEAFKLW